MGSESLLSMDFNKWDDQTATNNPDFNLALINAANDGFVSKARNGYGSFFIYTFVAALTRDIEEQRGEELSEIFDDVQCSAEPRKAAADCTVQQQHEGAQIYGQ